jgi:hypothetical protein
MKYTIAILAGLLSAICVATYAIEQGIKEKNNRIIELETELREYKFNKHTDSVISYYKKELEKKLDSSFNKTLK